MSKMKSSQKFLPKMGINMVPKVQYQALVSVKRCRNVIIMERNHDGQLCCAVNNYMQILIFSNQMWNNWGIKITVLSWDADQRSGHQFDYVACDSLADSAIWLLLCQNCRVAFQNPLRPQPTSPWKSECRFTAESRRDVKYIEGK